MPFVIVLSGKSGENGAEVQKWKKAIPRFPRKSRSFRIWVGYNAPQGASFGAKFPLGLGAIYSGEGGLARSTFSYAYKKTYKKLLTKKAKYAKIYLRPNLIIHSVSILSVKCTFFAFT